MDTRFVQCPDCDGQGEVQVGTAQVYEHGCGFAHPDAIMDKCPTCDGTGLAEQEVWPVECDDEIPSFQGTASPGNRAAHGRGEETVGTNPQSPSNRGVNAGGEAWQDGTPQGHRPSAASETTETIGGAGAELAGREGHIARGGDALSGRLRLPPTTSDFGTESEG